MSKHRAQMEQELDDLREELAAGMPGVPTFALREATALAEDRVAFLEDELA